MKEFIEEVEESPKVFLLIEVESHGETEIPVEAKHVLKEFEDVFPDEFPKELPPLRDIQHQIDLVPGAAPIAKAAYRMAPKELVEMKKQLDEMLQKG